MRQVDSCLQEGSSSQVYQAFLEHHKEKWTQSPDCPCPRCVALGKLVQLSIYKWQVLNQDNPKGE